MLLTPTKPVILKTPNGPRTYRPGETFKADEEKARPFIERGFLRPVGPVEELDRFFTSEILPRLSRLHKAGRLPNLATCPLWAEVDRLWQNPAPDVLKVKAAMETALKTYETPKQTLF